MDSESDAALMLLQVGTKDERLLSNDETTLHEKDDEEANFDEQDDDADSLNEQEEDGDHEDNEGVSSSGQLEANEADRRRKPYHRRRSDSASSANRRSSKKTTSAVTPMGELVGTNEICNRGCTSSRAWAGVYTAQKCNEECFKRKDCAYFWVSEEAKHCGVCTEKQYKSCRKGYQKGYNMYKKYVLTFPFTGTCKEAASSTKRLGKEKGCQKRVKDLGHFAWSYEKSTKTCRTWKTCTASAPGEYIIQQAR